MVASSHFCVSLLSLLPQGGIQENSRNRDGACCPVLQYCGVLQPHISTRYGSCLSVGAGGVSSVLFLDTTSCTSLGLLLQAVSPHVCTHCMSCGVVKWGLLTWFRHEIGVAAYVDTNNLA